MEWEKETVHTLRTKSLIFSFTENSDDEDSYLIIKQDEDGKVIFEVPWTGSFKQLKQFVHGFLVGRYSKKVNVIITDLDEWWGIE